MEPDTGTPAGAHRLRSLNQPAPVTVETDTEGIPRAVIQRRRRYAVEVVQETWRLDDEWWRPNPVSRLYYRLALEEGRIVTVYLDLLERRWWVQRA